MRIYSDEEEERLRLQGLVQDWSRDGLIDAAQTARLQAELAVDLRRTNVFLRAGLALFAAVIVLAVVGLIATSLGISDRVPIATLAAGAGLGCLVAAEFLVRGYRLYRFGIEEAVAVAGVVLLCVSAAALGWEHVVPVALMVGALGGFGLYRRFGFVYAAIGGGGCAAAIPFQLQLPAAAHRAIAACAIGAIFFLVRSKRLTYRDDYPGDEYGALQAAALAGIYALVNVQLTAGLYRVDGWFYWLTYFVVWMLPLAGLGLGVRARDRELLDVSVVLLLVTLATNKMYLGWPRHTWDPIVFGALLIAGATAIRRWLSSAPDGARGGFTAEPDGERNTMALSTLRVAALAGPPNFAGGTAGHGAAPDAFRGGSSGGAGGGAQF